MADLRFIQNNRQLIVGIGSALVDILIHEKDEFLEKTGAVKGGMTVQPPLFRVDQPAIPSWASANWAARLALSANAEPTIGGSNMKMISKDRM